MNSFNLSSSCLNSTNTPLNVKEKDTVFHVSLDSKVHLKTGIWETWKIFPKIKCFYSHRIVWITKGDQFLYIIYSHWDTVTQMKETTVKLTGEGPNQGWFLDRPDTELIGWLRFEFMGSISTNQRRIWSTNASTFV